MKAIRGCESDVPAYDVGGVRVTRCPVSFVGRKYDSFFLAHAFFMNGILPSAGGWGDQPNAIVQGVLWIDGEINRMDKDADSRR